MKKFFGLVFLPFVNDKYDLEGKWWHRFLKVVFYIILILVFVVSFFGFDILGKTNSLFSYGLDIRLINTTNAAIDFGEKDENVDITNKSSNNKKYLTKEKLKQIIDGRPEGVNPIDILNELEQKGYIIEGYNEKNYFIEEKSLYQKFFELFQGILFILLILYFTNILLQFVYYKMFLYVIYGNK